MRKTPRLRAMKRGSHSHRASKKSSSTKLEDLLKPLNPRKRVPAQFPRILYVYVESANYVHARTHGKKVFGSASTYVNALISLDRGEKPILGGSVVTPGKKRRYNKKPNLDPNAEFRKHPKAKRSQKVSDRITPAHRIDPILSGGY